MQAHGGASHRYVPGVSRRVPHHRHTAGSEMCYRLGLKSFYPSRIFLRTSVLNICSLIFFLSIWKINKKRKINNIVRSIIRIDLTTLVWEYSKYLMHSRIPHMSSSQVANASRLYHSSRWWRRWKWWCRFRTAYAKWSSTQSVPGINGRVSSPVRVLSSHHFLIFSVSLLKICNFLLKFLK